MIKEFLADCANIPYNSAARDLPSSYTDYPDTWGLDCVGFAQRAAAQLSETDVIRGWYDQGDIHVAALSGRKTYVDPYLRMRDGLDIYSSSGAATFYRGTVVGCQYNSDEDALTVDQIKYAIHPLNHYEFDLRQQDDMTDPPSGAYMFAFLHDGGQIVCKPAKVHGQHVIKVGGADPEDADRILRERFGIDLGGINEMFHQAIQNTRYYDFLEGNR